MRIDLAPVWLVTRRELRDQFRDWRVMFPLVVFSLLFPFLMLAMAGEALQFVERYGARLIAERFVPFFMLIAGFLPLTVSLVVSLESFVGEKERGTIEPLLSSPLADWQMYLGKLFAGLVFPVVSSYAAIGIYLLNLGRLNIPWPEPIILIQTLVLTGAHALVMVSGSIVISTQSTSVRAANLLASFIIIPVAALIQGETVLMFWGTNEVLWLALAGVVVLAVLLVRAGLAHFRREALLGREIDTINLRRIGSAFWRAFRGGARTPAAWYRRSVFPALRALRLPLIITLLAGLAGVLVAHAMVLRFVPDLLRQLDAAEMPAWAEAMGSGEILSRTVPQISAAWLFGHNLQALLAGFLLGTFSFGVVSMLSYLANVGLIGALLGLVQLAGYSPWAFFLAGILPHGLFELPALVLSAAAVLRMGAVLVTPDARRSIGEVFLDALADWAKVLVGLIIPLLLVAAVIEAHLTPHLLLAVLGP